MVVADGMGRHAAGEVASAAAIRFLSELVLKTPDWIMRLDIWCGACHTGRDLAVNLSEHAPGGSPAAASEHLPAPSKHGVLGRNGRRLGRGQGRPAESSSISFLGLFERSAAA
jgi:hypothetical protein